MAVQIDLKYTVDLNRPMQVEFLPTLLFAGDDHAHRFIITAMRGEQAENLTGCVIEGYIIRGDDATHKLDGSVDSDGHAVLVLDRNCYAAYGRIQVAIRAIRGDVKTVIFAAEGGIHRVTSDSLVDPDNVVPSIEQLLEKLDDMDKATQAALDAAHKANNAVGPTPDLTIGTVTTLPAGSQATATITGTPEYPVLNLGLPKGVDGDGADGAVQSVNGKTGAVNLTAQDVGAVGSVNGKTGAVTLSAQDTGALPISGGTLTGAQAVNVKCVRNIYAGTEALETGVSALETGVIYIQYE